MKNQEVKIVPYKAEYERAFVGLNRAWIEKYFCIEPADTAIFNSPEKTIIQKGGFIFCALVSGDVAGVCALQKISTPKYEYELSKLAVEPRYQGLGIGEKLCRAAVEKAQSLSEKKILIESNTKLTAAINLYKKLGFSETDSELNPNFSRVDIVLEL